MIYDKKKYDRRTWELTYFYFFLILMNFDFFKKYFIDFPCYEIVIGIINSCCLYYKKFDSLKLQILNF